MSIKCQLGDPAKRRILSTVATEHQFLEKFRITSQYVDVLLVSFLNDVYQCFCNLIAMRGMKQFSIKKILLK